MSSEFFTVAKDRLLVQGWRFTGGHLVLTTGVEGVEIYSPSGERQLLSNLGAVYSVMPEWIHVYTPPGSPANATTATGSDAPTKSGSGLLLALGAVLAFLKFRKR